MPNNWQYSKVPLVAEVLFQDQSIFLAFKFMSSKFLRDHVLKGDCVLEFVDTKNQLADTFTKPFPKDTFFSIRRELGLLDISDLDK